MYKVRIISLLLLLPFITRAQVIFKTKVPQQPVAVGESFPLQYVLEDAEDEDGFTPPPFKDFRLVSGPFVYPGSVYDMNGNQKKLKNIFFTLMATRPGKFILPGASATVNGSFVKSDNAIIEVIAKPKTLRQPGETAAEYFLRPGEDPYEKMRKNLFMKVVVDKKTCYVGEPVVATFKLYSRLVSRSDIVKNPGFYGFAVQDMIGLNDNLITSETINGKAFDVHVVRMAQLYPLREGTFTIDAMEVMNKAEFSRNEVSRKSEQEIVEGVLNKPEYQRSQNAEVFENSISTEPITIYVKAYPEKNRPTSFTGATGHFSIHSSLEKSDLAKNEEGAFIITISGKGNFTQLAAPIVHWPTGIENFEPVINDSLDKSKSPLKGSRKFRFSFISPRAGYYTIPPVSFSYFDTDSNKYKTVYSDSTIIKIGSERVKEPALAEAVNPKGKQNRNRGLLTWIGAGLLLIMLVVIGWAWWKKPNKVVNQQVVGKTEAPISIEQLLQSAQFSLVADDGRFYSRLQKSIWDYLSLRLGLSGSRMNKQDLLSAMKERKWDEIASKNILDVLQQCEASMFTSAEFGDDKQTVLDKAKASLERLEA